VSAALWFLAGGATVVVIVALLLWLGKRALENTGWLNI
jgi:hypothetical protein